MSKRKITQKEIEAMNRLYRINLINSLSGYKSANLVGTIDKLGVYNLAVFSSVTHFGSNPPILGMVTRPLTTPRHTYHNLKEIGEYTINHIHTGIIDKAHQTAAKYEPQISEFEEVGLTTWFSEKLKAPYVKEAAIQIGLQYLEEYVIKANNTVLVLGEIKEIWINESLIAKDGFIDLNKAQTTAISGLDAYHLPKQLDRFEYARPQQLVKSMYSEKA